jgi:A/G-specific adenine glycosylase
MPRRTAATTRAPARHITSLPAAPRGRGPGASGGATASLPDAAARRRFRAALLAWYRRHGRDLPWRRTGDPYHILVSEVMLQQTQVDRVLPKYQEWLARYPDFEALAAAPEAEVVRSWHPLGYNIRPRRLQSIAREAVARFEGRLPDDEGTLRSFKGIGAYTAGAVMSFAFGRRAAILDTNVARVLSRVFLGRTADGKGPGTRHLWDISRAVLPHKHVFDFNQGLMDLGALVCTARKPRCLACPLARQCHAYLLAAAPRHRPGNGGLP